MAEADRGAAQNETDEGQADPGISKEDDKARKDLAKATRDVTVFGIALGKRLNLPKCPELGIGETCLDKDGHVKFPRDDLPDWAQNPGWTTVETRGHSIVVQIVISELTESPDLYAALLHKYGKPTSKRRVSFRNPYGVISSAMSWEWSLPGLHVSFAVQHMSPEGFEGDLTVELESFYRSQKAKADADAAGRLKF